MFLSVLQEGGLLASLKAASERGGNAEWPERRIEEGSGRGLEVD